MDDVTLAGRVIVLLSAVAMAGTMTGVMAGAGRAQTPKPGAPPTVVDVVDVSPVWAGHPVGFALLTHGQEQYVAFYDAERNMTVGKRKVGEKKWAFARLPETVGWDSHNYITMTMDDDNNLHLSGNMHAGPLVYFRTTKPGDINSFVRIKTMVGSEELRTTYPRFFRGPKKELIYTYRTGGSGNGDQIYNVYDHKTRKWSRLLDQPLTNGEGERNAYLNGPTLGPDGYYHLVWVWRETPDASTNHDLSYARSKDLRHWEKSDGTPLTLPISIKTAEVIDPVPEKGGMLNGNTVIGWDSQKRPVVTYHKHDAKGNTQIYNARREGNSWKIYQVTDWDYRWDFGGGGTIGTQIRVRPIQLEADGKLTQGYWHEKKGSGVWAIDEATLRPIGMVPDALAHPVELSKVSSSFPGMQTRTAGDSGSSGEKGVRYVLRWETLGANRDKPRPEPWPEPTILRLYKLQ